MQYVGTMLLFGDGWHQVRVVGLASVFVHDQSFIKAYLRYSLHCPVTVARLHLLYQRLHILVEA